MATAVIRVLCGHLTRLDFTTVSSVQCNNLKMYFEEKLRISFCFPWVFSIFICCCGAPGALVETHGTTQPYTDLLQRFLGAL